uniref:Uncharacterized protein n=1 Tax=Hanusia phi TaxID=3032 RepID=A0A7S0ES00_9CRYP|mmetsp:Transcript_29915/g.67672  ORF Transcript_29915/g.67672 Transcript_29915/m.67672 type:complete len:658 (+) Transcript_29915:281-2254(+)
MIADDDAMQRLGQRVKSKFLNIANKGSRRLSGQSASSQAKKSRWKGAALSLEEEDEATGDESLASSRIRLFLRRISRDEDVDAISICTDQDELNEMGPFSQNTVLPKLSSPSRHLQKYSESPVCPNSAFVVPTELQAFGKNLQKRKSKFLGSEDHERPSLVPSESHDLANIIEAESDDDGDQGGGDEDENEDEQREGVESEDGRRRGNVGGGEPANLKSKLSKTIIRTHDRVMSAATANNLTSNNPLFKSAKRSEKSANSPIFSLDEEKEVLERVKKFDVANIQMSIKLARLALSKDTKNIAGKMRGNRTNKHLDELDPVVHRADINIGEVIRGEVGNSPQVCVFRLGFSRSSHLNTLRNKKLRFTVRAVSACIPNIMISTFTEPTRHTPASSAFPDGFMWMGKIDGDASVEVPPDDPDAIDPLHNPHGVYYISVFSTTSCDLCVFELQVAALDSIRLPTYHKQVATGYVEYSLLKTYIKSTYSHVRDFHIQRRDRLHRLSSWQADSACLRATDCRTSLSRESIQEELLLRPPPLLQPLPQAHVSFDPALSLSAASSSIRFSVHKETPEAETSTTKAAVRETLSSVRCTLASSHAERVSKAPTSFRASTPRVSETLEKLFRAAGVVDATEDEEEREEEKTWTEQGDKGISTWREQEG